MNCSYLHRKKITRVMHPKDMSVINVWPEIPKYLCFMRVWPLDGVKGGKVVDNSNY